MRTLDLICCCVGAAIAGYSLAMGSVLFAICILAGITLDIIGEVILYRIEKRINEEENLK